jgi:hypothetical protein
MNYSAITKETSEKMAVKPNLDDYQKIIDNKQLQVG